MRERERGERERVRVINLKRERGRESDKFEEGDYKNHGQRCDALLQ
jgi:hypothetical protein